MFLLTYKHSVLSNIIHIKRNMNLIPYMNLNIFSTDYFYMCILLFYVTVFAT